MGVRVDFSIFCFGDGDFLTSLFRAVASMTGSGDFRFALMLVVSYAFLTLLMMGMLRGQLLDLRWFFGVMLIYSLCLLPRVNVSVEDRLQGGWGGAPVVHVVGNVPIGLAFIASTSSKLGDWLTETLETVLSLPGGLNYLDNGPLFASSVVSSINQFQIANPDTAYGLNNFWHNCAFYDMELGFYSMQDLADASDLEDFFRTRSAGNRGFDYVDTQGQHQIVDCNKAFSGYLDQDIQLAVTAGLGVLPWQQQAVETTKVISTAASALPIAFQYLSGLALSGSQALTQAAMINSFSNGLQGFSAEANASAAVTGYAQAVAEQQRSIDYGVLSKISAKTLPVLRDLIEGFIDCLFPVVAIWSLLPGGYRALGNYFRAQVWIALWPPVYSVLNYAVTFFSAIASQKALQVCAAGYNCVPSYTLATLHGFQQELHLHATIAGFLMTSIPMISWLIVSQSAAMLSAVAGRVMDGYAQPAAQAAHALATGNISQGTLQLDNIQAWHQNSAPVNQQGFFSTDSGNFTVRSTASGAVAQQQLSQLAIGNQWVDSIDRSYSQAHELAKAQVARTEQDYLQSQQKLYSLLTSTADAVDRSTAHHQGHSTTRDSATETMQHHMDNALRGFSKNATHSEDFSHNFRVSGQFGLNFSAENASNLSAEGLSFKAGLMYDAVAKNSDLTQSQHLDNFVHSDEYANAIKASEHDLSTRIDETASSTLHRQLHEVQAQQQQVDKEQTQYTEAVSNEQKTAQRWQQVQSHHEEIRYALGNALLEQMQQQGVDWQKGLDDLSRQHASVEAESIRHWLNQLLDQQKNQP